jgi:hypothetical protein
MDPIFDEPGMAPFHPVLKSIQRQERVMNDCPSIIYSRIEEDATALLFPQISGNWE